MRVVGVRNRKGGRSEKGETGGMRKGWGGCYGEGCGCWRNEGGKERGRSG